MVDANTILDRYDALSPHLDERRRRSFAAVEARAAGHGGIVAVARATGIAPSTIGRGLKELACGSDLPNDRVRRPGGGRKKLVATDTGLLDDLLALVLPDERGDPMSPLRWTCKSLRRLSAELCKLSHTISQGGVISPILVNLYLHYAFDMWMPRTFPAIPFERYADDCICHCRSEEEARALRAALEVRFAACGLVCTRRR